MHILGLFGPQRAGKSTLTGILRSRKSFLDLSISKAIKDECETLMGMTFREEDKDTKLPVLNGKSPRDLYIHIGQLDEFVPSWWIDRLFRRFSVEAIKQRGGVIESVGKQAQWDWMVYHAAPLNVRCHLISVSRPGYDYKDNRTPVVGREDPYIVENDGDETDFRSEMQDQAAEILADVYGKSQQDNEAACAADAEWARKRVKHRV